MVGQDTDARTQAGSVASALHCRAVLFHAAAAPRSMKASSPGVGLLYLSAAPNQARGTRVRDAAAPSRRAHDTASAPRLAPIKTSRSLVLPLRGAPARALRSTSSAAVPVAPDARPSSCRPAVVPVAAAPPSSPPCLSRRVDGLSGSGVSRDSTSKVRNFRVVGQDTDARTQAGGVASALHCRAETPLVVHGLKPCAVNYSRPQPRDLKHPQVRALKHPWPRALKLL